MNTCTLYNIIITYMYMGYVYLFYNRLDSTVERWCVVLV